MVPAPRVELGTYRLQTIGVASCLIISSLVDVQVFCFLQWLVSARSCRSNLTCSAYPPDQRGPAAAGLLPLFRLVLFNMHEFESLTVKLLSAEYEKR